MLIIDVKDRVCDKNGALIAMMKDRLWCSRGHYPHPPVTRLMYAALRSHIPPVLLKISINSKFG